MGMSIKKKVGVGLTLYMNSVNTFIITYQQVTTVLTFGVIIRGEEILMS